MSFTIRIKAGLLPKNIKFKDNELVDWGKKSLKEKSEQEIIVSLVEEMRITPKEIFKHLRVQLGQRVEPEQVIAEKRSFVSRSVYRSPDEAEVRGIDHVEGTVTLAIEKVIEVPFAFEAVFVKKENDEYLFKVKEGVEVPVTSAIENNFGGYTSYLHQPSDITLENCENKVVFNQTEDIMDQAKINALDPIAVVSYKADYKGLGTPLLLVENKNDWTGIFHKKWQMSLYLSGSKTLYLYNP